MKKLFLLLPILWGAIAFAQPTGSCTTGTTQLGTDGILYGCVESSWKRLSELSIATAALPTTQGITQNIGGNVYIREMNNSVRQLKNIGFVPVTLVGQTHEAGKIVYDSRTKHFYEGVNNGLWHQIDNQERQCLGQPMPGWSWFRPGTMYTCTSMNGNTEVAPSEGVWLMKASCAGDVWIACHCRTGPANTDNTGWETECP